ncbi:MAG: hypothetical protein AAF713_09245 [Pseudomonadota bacterium]
MAEFSVEGEALKKFLALAKKKPVPFGFCPGTQDDEHVMAMDRKKGSEFLGKYARSEGIGGKMTHGTLAVEGKSLLLTCERELPGVAKKLKRWLKLNRATLNVKILGKDGVLLEEDVEDLGQDDAAAAVDDTPQEVATAPAEAKPDPRLARLRAAITATEERIDTVPSATARAKLTAAISKVLSQIEAGQVEQAIASLKTVQQALAKHPAAAAADRTAAKWQEVREKLQPRVQALTAGGAAAPVAEAWNALLAKETAGDFAGALKEAPGLVRLIKEAQAPAPRQSPPASKDDAPARDAAEAAWRAAKTLLEPQYANLVQQNIGDVSALRVAWDLANEKALEGNFLGATQALPPLERLIADGQAALQSEVEASIPADVVPLHRARAQWAVARRSLDGEMGKLQTAIIQRCGAVGLGDVAAETNALFTHLSTIDERLEVTLDALMADPAGTGRDGLEAQAKRIVNDYLSALETPFFKDVDDNNGFIAISVRGAAMKALEGVRGALG